MKRFLIFCLALLLAASFNCPSFAQPDGDDGEPIPLEAFEPGGDEDPIFRGPTNIPIEVGYFSSFHSVSVNPLLSIGEVSVAISNLSTNESYNTVVYSQNGSAFIPISGNPGLWRILLTLDTGASYIGFFSIVQ